MSYLWMIIPILPILAGIALATTLVQIIVQLIPKITTLDESSLATVMTQILALYGLAIFSFFVAAVLGGIAMYYLIRRRNSHFMRQQQLFETLAEYVTLRSSQTDDNGLRLRLIVDDSKVTEIARPAALWATMNIFVTPLVGLIVAYSLTKDLAKHEEHQSKYAQTLNSAMNALNVPIPALAVTKPHRRDPLLYLILTAITGGLFWIVWFYTLLKDYNEHFIEQANFEDTILQTLSPMGRIGTCPNCNAPIPDGARFCPSCGRAL